MDDALLVSRAIGGDLDSFGQLYDRYFNRVYDFCWRVTRDGDEAAAASRDVFTRAMRDLPRLGRAATFKAWIFGMAQDIAVARAERAGESAPLPVPSADEAFGTFDVPDPSRLADPALAAADAELPGLVWEAASSLNPRDYALLDLHLRQGLEPAEIAPVLGVSKGNASTMVSRMKAAAGDVISGYVVARRGGADCEGLRSALAPFALPPYSDDVRRALEAHVAGCETCQRARRALPPPLAIFGAFAAVSAPFALKGETWRDLAGQWPWPASGAGERSRSREADFNRTRDATLAAAAGGAGGAGAGGLAYARDGDDGGNRIVLFAVAALGMVIFAFALAGGVILANRGGNGGGGGAKPTAEARTPSTPGVVVETPTANLTPSVTPTPEPATPTPTAAPDTATPEPTLEPPTAEPPTATAIPDTPVPADTPTRTPRAGTRTATPTPDLGGGGGATPAP